MVRCRVCGAEIQLRARTCPRCGEAGPGRGSRTNGVLLVVLGAGIAGGFVFLSKQFTGTPPTPPSPAEIAASCDADWTKCPDNAALMGVPEIAEDIKTKCLDAGDRQSKYGTPAWPFNAFAGFHAGRDYVESGIAVAIENAVQVETRSGGVMTTQAVCRYDLLTKTVLGLEFARSLDDTQAVHRHGKKLAGARARRSAESEDVGAAE